MEKSSQTIAPWTNHFSGEYNEIMTFVLTERVQVEMNLKTGNTFLIKDNVRIAEDQFYIKEECSLDEVIRYLRMQYNDAVKLETLPMS